MIKKMIILILLSILSKVWSLPFSNYGMDYLASESLRYCSYCLTGEFYSDTGYYLQDKLQQEYTETPARRAEIVFLISFPFSLLLNMTTTALVYQAATGNMNLPGSAWAFAVTSAVLFSSAIAWQDHLAVFGQNSEVLERRMSFSYSLPFMH